MVQKRILLVDDDPDVLDYLSTFLEDHDYETQTAIDSISALSALERFTPHIILIDVLMPGKSGLDLLVKLRKDPKWEEIPIIIVTGSDKILEDDCQSYLGSHHGIRGPDGVLGKPINQETLIKILHHMGSEE